MIKELVDGFEAAFDSRLNKLKSEQHALKKAKASLDKCVQSTFSTYKEEVNASAMYTTIQQEVFKSYSLADANKLQTFFNNDDSLTETYHSKNSSINSLYTAINNRINELSMLISAREEEIRKD